MTSFLAMVTVLFLDSGPVGDLNGRVTCDSGGYVPGVMVTLEEGEGAARLVG